MAAHERLAAASAKSRKMQKGIRRATFAPEETKTLRRFSAWEVAELILGVNRNTFNRKVREDAGMPDGILENENSGMKWFSVDEINEIRASWIERGGKRPLLPNRPMGKRALRAAIANFKGGAGKSVTALHFAHAAALDGYRVLVVDFDPQATISHAMGLIDVPEDLTVWGIIGRDCMRETKRANMRNELTGQKDRYSFPEDLVRAGVETLRDEDFIAGTCWPTIDMIGSCANAAFVEFATAQYRMSNGKWDFYRAVDRYLNKLPPDRYDLILFDCPPAIGYQSLNAVYAADILYVPTGPGYWEYDSTTSFMSQLSEALSELAASSGKLVDSGVSRAKDFAAIKVVLTRFEPSNDLHIAMRDALSDCFDDWMTKHPIELTRAVEQTGRFLQSVYEMDYRKMTRDTWKRARRSFDAAYAEFRETLQLAWDHLPDTSMEADMARNEIPA
jgi:cellulose biosynthesis protein BcsQ